MNPIHFHLLITHLPVFASFFGGILLVYGRIRQSEKSRQAAYVMLIIAGLGTLASNISGEEAEHLAERIPGIAEELIEEHEESVRWVFWTLVPCALASIAGLWTCIKRPQMEKWFAIVAISLSLIGFVAVSRTAWLGGQIRHSELNANQDSKSNGADEQNEFEDSE
jgi:drug/metabolite transporter (DMT)-like permease